MSGRRATAKRKAISDTVLTEEELRRRGYRRIAGVDEAGRGPLAGPVVAAAIVLEEGWTPNGIRDSKEMTLEQREAAFETLLRHCSFAVGVASPDEIDRHNILKATWLAMRRAVAALDPPPDFVLVDGLPIGETGFPYQSVVKGDARYPCIAAASIIAKVTRDRIMVEMDTRHPGYGFSAHKGYPTPRHLEALRRLGPCAAHRFSFQPVKELRERTLFADRGGEA